MFHVEQIMIELNKCPSCFSSEIKESFKAKDHFLSQESFGVYECLSCELKFTNPRPQDSALSLYYQSTDYISHSDTNKGLVSRLYHFVRGYTLSSKEKLVRSFVSRGTMLDYGCGTGHFLNYCKNKGWKVHGIEPDSGARAIALKNLELVYSNKEEFKTKETNIKFNAICLWHVLEHLSDLHETLEFLSKSIHQNGALIVALPNYKSWDARYYKTNWAAFDLPRHLYHFEKKSVSLLLAKYGFELKQIKPMVFDSFYVSLLSEKYKKGHSSFLSGIFNGLLSNISALRTGNYSSLIYVFQKA